MIDDQASARTSVSECQVCPVCMGLTALRQARPEVMEHLMAAGLELILALRALVDAAASDGAAAPMSEGVQRIDIG